MAIYKFELPCNLQNVFCRFWQKSDFYHAFLEEQGDIDIVLNHWEPDASSASLSRTLECSHPVKVSFPGTPSHSRCFRRQTIKFGKDTATTSLTMSEAMRIEGIPYSDYFTVDTVWKATEHRHQGSSSTPRDMGRLEAGSSSTAATVVVVEVFVTVQFIKSTWLKGTISSNAESEAKEAQMLWQESASKILLERNEAPFDLGGHAPSPTNGPPLWFSPTARNDPAAEGISALSPQRATSSSPEPSASDPALVAAPIPPSLSHTSLSSSVHSYSSAQQETLLLRSSRSNSGALCSPDRSDTEDTVGGGGGWDSEVDGAEFFDAGSSDDNDDDTVSLGSQHHRSSGGAASFMEDVERARRGTYRGHGAHFARQARAAAGAAADAGGGGPFSSFAHNEGSESMGQALVVIAEFVLWQLGTFNLLEALGPYFAPRPSTVLGRLARALAPTPSSCRPAYVATATPHQDSSQQHPHLRRRSRCSRLHRRRRSASGTLNNDDGNGDDDDGDDDGIESGRGSDDNSLEEDDDGATPLLVGKERSQSAGGDEEGGGELPPPSSALSVLAEPDLYGPVMVVLSLAQVLLWCIDVTGEARPHSHCSRETLLGTSLLVALSSWVGAALWYHLVAYLLGAARLRLVHSFAATGYACFGWCLALVVSQLFVLLRQREHSVLASSHSSLNPMEQEEESAVAAAAAATALAARFLSGGHGDSSSSSSSSSGSGGSSSAPRSHRLEVYLAGLDWAAAALSDGPEWALLALGLPSGAALACVFAHATPKRFHGHVPGHGDSEPGSFSHSANPPAAAAAAAPGVSGVRQWVCSRWPRALCFVLVVVTHVEVLRYLHHVVIPGEQLLCAVWSGVRPEDFAKFDYKELKRLAYALRHNTKQLPF